jgi:cellulose synthase/poly-beta-1,6-N-acetylglucosamine synthase-like glycosyltransferase
MLLCHQKKLKIVYSVMSFVCFTPHHSLVAQCSSQGARYQEISLMLLVGYCMVFHTLFSIRGPHFYFYECVLITVIMPSHHVAMSSQKKIMYSVMSFVCFTPHHSLVAQCSSRGARYPEISIILLFYNTVRLVQPIAKVNYFNFSVQDGSTVR